MFETLQPVQGDSLLGLIAAYKADARAEKIDVGVGVYRDETGATPVLAAVKTAEQRLLQAQDSKAYIGLVGDARFNAAMLDLVLGPQAPALHDRTRAVQTAGGCGALRALAELAALARPGARIWLSRPTWANHASIFRAARLELQEYPYFDLATQTLRFDEMLAALEGAGPGDVVLLHGCCHNPTGADLTAEQWDAVADVAARRGFLPFVDLAYQGFGQGLDADAVGVRKLAAKVGEMLVAVSCSKNFALYRERTGCAIVLGAESKSTGVAFDSLLGLLRANYSMPPDHGAAVVASILTDATLKAGWHAELDTMRGRLNGLRQELSAQFRARTNGTVYDHIAAQSGMFSMLGLQRAEVERLRSEHAIYMPGDSRINVAGLRREQIGRFVDAVLAVRGTTH